MMLIYSIIIYYYASLLDDFGVKTLFSGTDNMALWCPVDILLATDITRWTVLTFPCNLYFALNERSILIVLGIPVLSMGLTVYSRSILSPVNPSPTY